MTRLVAAAVILAGCGEPALLSEEVTAAGMLEHLEALEDIALDHDGHRAAFTEGYQASADYVTEQLELAGYEVEVHPFTVSLSELLSSALSQVEPAAVDYPFEGEGELGYAVFGGSPSADLTASVAAVDLTLPPGDDPNTSTSGCEAEDFADFPVGSMALIQRGACAFSTKVALAEEAGASAVLIFNEGQEGRTEWLVTTISPFDPPDVPVLGLSYALGAELASLVPEGVVLHLVTEVTWREATDVNLWADTPGGDPEGLILVGAHLDGVEAGPGINDNGSGTALVLETALQLAYSGLEPTRQVRFAWWGAEELGLVGSYFYARDILDEEWAYLNFDMVASGNGLPIVYAATSTAGDPQHPPPAELAIREHFADWLVARGLPYGIISGTYISDDRWFLEAGVPSGGLFTGASTTKTEYEAELFGGTAGEPYDPCYHQPCDDVDHLDPVLLDLMGATAAHALQALADREDPLTHGPLPSE